MPKDARQIFALIDQQDTEAFVSNLTEDVVFQFGNNDPAVGRDQVRQAVNGFFSTIAGLTHHVREVWDVEENTSVVYIDVEYRRTDGETVYIPNVDILKWRGDQAYDWQIIIDVAPIYTPIDQVPAAVRSLATQPA